MNRKLTFKFAFAIAVTVMLAYTSTAKAQSACSDCLPGAASFFDSGDCGCSSSMTLPGCDDGCCDNLGTYVSVFGGLATIHQLENELNIPIVLPGDPDTEFRSFSGDNAEVYGIAIGKVVHQRARMEMDFVYQDDFDLDFYRVEQFDEGVLRNSTLTPVVGEIETYSLMGNFLFDLSPRCVGSANLYGGGGLGIMDINGSASGGGVDYEIDDTAFAYQLIAGVNYAAKSRMDLYTEYKFIGSSVDVFDATNVISLGSFDFETNTVVFGVRIRR